jgi:nucleoredoxin
MSGLAALLGDKLVSSSGEISTAEALGGKEAVALYFSAHWCPPCRGFTPKLVEWYSKSLKARGLEVVFVSSDRDEQSFKEYFGEMPWLALPYNDRATKDSLSKKFKVQGIPSVIILDAEGKVITKDGRDAISSDPTGEDFPWTPKTFQEIMSGAEFLGEGGKKVNAESLNGKTLGLYFSAHWCPPCKAFTPKLAEWYSSNLKSKGLEVVFVSSDRDEESFKEYFREMPWLALDFADRKRKDQLSSMFGVNGIPAFVVIDKDGSTITTNGRAAVSSDPAGVEFPWYPKPVADLKSGPGSIEEVPTVIAFCESSDAAMQKAIEEQMTPIAQRYINEKKAQGLDDVKFSFMVATKAGGIAGRLRELMALPASKAFAKPKLMLIDIPEDGAFYAGPEGEITVAGIEKLLRDYEAGSLEKKQLQG